jgi:Mn-dependent DtxR family transcriptional regulator
LSVNSGDGYLDTAQLSSSLHISKPTALRTMTELAILELVDVDPDLGTEDNVEHTGLERKIKLKQQYSWIKSEEFKRLRQDFVPTDNTEDMEGGGA